MEDALANLRLLDDEEEAIQEDKGAVNGAYQFCLVGRCLTDSVVHFPSLCNTMADLWHPIGGICITELGEKRYLFQFFNEVGIERVVVGKSWFFNNHLLILQKIPGGENPAALELNFTEFWIQVHELPPGLKTESMAKQFGDFCGKFIEYDTSRPSLGIQNFLRIRVCLDVTAPLKRKKKVLIGKSMIVYARDLSLHAVVRRRNMAVSRWLRAADGSPCVTEKLVSFNYGISINKGKDLGRNFRGIVGNQNSNPNLIPLGSVQYHSNNRQIKGRDRGNDALVADGLVYGPMDLVLEEEDDPIALLKDHCPLLLDIMGVVWNNQDYIVKPFSVLGKLEELGHHLLKWSKSTGREEKRNRIELEDRLTNLYNQDLANEILAKITEVAVQRHFCGRITELQDENGGRANSSEEFV
ncbi:hypothetical protein Gotri_021033 [Gossypium trilobum]|uniref:DUF4283 domain-containing protein n=1 Tax=Gossypium trilobum TaxID=34281 RepID=A0A7J9DBA4_9ROSI|nr:hypothetical protein [Gossypium trilobum]